tara:strand:- start:721 stop:1221 length:501 start_codon:yes stop_codon:yes gene_type:complete
MLIIFFLIKITSKGNAIYWSKRIGKNNKIFKMPKFRTMSIETPSVATHLLANPNEWITPIGKVLRRYSLDELPQLWSILYGHMSVVGPRPALFNQDDLIKLRTELMVHTLMPGLTGLAQINGRDELSIKNKVKFDFEYLNNKSLLLDILIIIKTIKKVFINPGINH